MNLSVFLIVLVYGVIFSRGDSNLPPICDVCKCNTTADLIHVVCEKQSDVNAIFNQSMFLIPKSESRNIFSLTLKVNLFKLEQIFPTIPLRKLDLSECSLNVLGDGVFKNLQQMEELILSNNELEVVQPGAFKGLQMDGADYPLRSLKMLRLDHNRFHSLNDDVFQHVEDSLEILDLSSNPFKVIDQLTLFAIGSLHAIKVLNLSETGISHLPEHFFHTPKKLEVINLSKNPFTQVPNGLEEAHALHTLYLDATRITSLTRNSTFPKMPTLKALHFSRNPLLQRIEDGAFSNLLNLEEVHVRDNIRLSEIGVAAFARHDFENEVWPPIKKVYFDNNQLAYLDIHLILHWDKLDDLDLTDNPWACECENQWLVDELIPSYIKVKGEKHVEAMRCESPIEMRNLRLIDLYKKKSKVRCLDIYGHRPERDAALLVGLLITLLMGMAVVLCVFMAYKKGLLGHFSKSPAGFSRQFYARTHSDEL